MAQHIRLEPIGDGSPVELEHNGYSTQEAGHCENVSQHGAVDEEARVEPFEESEESRLLVEDA